jgi:hypothetical protein
MKFIARGALSGTQKEKPIVLFVTYTMEIPVVAGALIRALRLAQEFHRRGWRPIICNTGPEIDDPKVKQARATFEFFALDNKLHAPNKTVSYQLFKSMNPSVIIMGESPFPIMRPFYDGARMVDCPFVVLDQFYNNWLVPDKSMVDLIFLYGLKSFWQEDAHLRHPYVLTPPFIEAVTRKSQLPVPAHLHDRKWLTLVAYSSAVLRKGIRLLGSLGDVDAAFITVSHRPEEAAELLDKIGVPSSRYAALPLQSDANVYGLTQASSATIISNGFLQIMDSLAMGTPVIALKRGHGVGMGSLNIDDRFLPFVSFYQTREQQRERLLQWLKADPFPPSLLEALQSERGGTRMCADMIEELMTKRRMKRRVALRVERLFSNFGRAVSR